METFYMVLTLSSLVGPQVQFLSHPQQWQSELACRHALPRMEGAVTRLLRFDASTVELLGITSGSLNAGYFVSASSCASAEPSP